MPATTLRIDEDTRPRLDEPATATDRTKSCLAQNTRTDFPAHNVGQVAEIQYGIAEVDSGRGVDPDATGQSCQVR